VLALSDDEDGDLVLPVSSVTPGPDGRFVVDGLSDGEYRLRLADRDRVLVGGARTYRPGADVRLITSTLTGAAKLVPVGEWIDDETGLPNPLQDGTLTIWPPDRERDRQRVHFSRFRDEPGHSVADGPVEPGVYRGTLEVQGYKPVAIDRLVVPDGERAPRIRVRLKEPKGRIEGSVRDAAGRRPPGEIGVRVMTTLSTATLRTATVGDDGSFAVAVPLERPFDAIVEIESARLRVAPRRIDLDANAFARVDFVVEPAGAIRVRAPAGRVPKFRVVATAQRLGADGRATGTDRTVELDAAWITAHGPERTLGGLEAGRYRLRVAWDGDGWPEQTVDVAVGATTDVDLRAP
jgi:hypothetical protein